MGYGTLYIYLLQQQQQQHQLFYGYYTDQPVSTGTTISETEDEGENAQMLLNDVSYTCFCTTKRQNKIEWYR